MITIDHNCDEQHSNKKKSKAYGEAWEGSALPTAERALETQRNVEVRKKKQKETLTLGGTIFVVVSNKEQLNRKEKKKI